MAKRKVAPHVRIGSTVIWAIIGFVVGGFLYFGYLQTWAGDPSDFTVQALLIDAIMGAVVGALFGFVWAGRVRP